MILGLYILSVVICIPLVVWCFTKPHWGHRDTGYNRKTHGQYIGSICVCFIPFFNLFAVILQLDSDNRFAWLHKWLRTPL